MKLEIQRDYIKLNQKIEVIPSKSIAHRALVCSSFSNGPTHIICKEVGEDLLATVTCLQKMGAKITRTEDGFFVVPMTIMEQRKLQTEKVPKLLLDCRESATTYRFLQGMGQVLGWEAHIQLIGTERLLKRVTSGVTSSQTLSGKLLAQPLRIDGRYDDILDEIPENLPSRAYVELSKQVMSTFGCNLNNCTGGGYQSPGEYLVEGDWSAAAFWLAAKKIGELSGETYPQFSLSGLNADSAQADRKIINLLERLFSEGEEDRRIAFDGSSCPDLVPVLAIAAAFSQKEVSFVNIAHLRWKESDRIRATVQMVRDLGGNAFEIIDGFVLQGTGSLRGGTVNAVGDHRIAMSGAVAAVGCRQPVIVDGAECVSKSYPKFWEEFLWRIPMENSSE